MKRGDIMVTIRDFMINNENVPIIIESKQSRDRHDPLSMEIWRGMLDEIPVDLCGLEVISAGFGLAAQCNVLVVVGGESDV